MTSMLPVVGKTPEGFLVVTGVYKFFETHGMPLDALFAVLIEHKLMPSWIDFYDAAKRGGMQHDRIVSKLDPAIVDVYGAEFRDQVFDRLRRFRVCKGVIPNTWIACGEGDETFGRFYCSDECQSAGEKRHGNARQ